MWGLEEHFSELLKEDCASPREADRQICGILAWFLCVTGGSVLLMDCITWYLGGAVTPQMIYVSLGMIVVGACATVLFLRLRPK